MAGTKTQPALTISLEPSPKAAEGLTLLQTAQHLAVVDKHSHTLCLETLKGAKALKRSIQDHYEAIKRPLNDTRATVLQMERDHLAPIDAAISVLEKAATAYAAAQRRLEQEEADRRRRAEEEAERIRRQQEADEAEARALALEASSNVLSEREQAFVEIVAKSIGAPSPDYVFSAAKRAGYKDFKKQADRLMDSAKIQTAIANAQKAAAIRRESEAKQAAPIVVETAPVESQVGKVAGVSQRTYFACKEPTRDQVLALAKAVVDGRVEPEAIMANMVFLNQSARALKDHFARVFPMLTLEKRDGIAG